MQKKTIFILLFVLLISCEKTSKTEHQTEGSALETNITRLKKRVIRYDCKDNITSDRIETVNSVSKRFYLRPKKSSKLYDFHATNETTDSSQGSLWLGKGVFTLDLAPTLFNIKANEGMNKISWNFTYCNELIPKSNNCKHVPEVKESGVLFIHIRYDVRTLEGTDHIKPTPEDCKA